MEPKPTAPTQAPAAGVANDPAQVVTTPAALKLPVLVFGIVEVRRLKRELEALEEFIAQMRLREPGKQMALPRLSRLLDALAAENRLNLLQPEHRKTLRAFLEQTIAQAPVIHMSFATDPSSAFTAKLVTWLRTNIAPNTLLDVGLQPTLAAGAMVRTTNKVFDMSLRERFADAHGLLVESLEQGGAEIAASPPTPAQAPAVAAVSPAVPPAPVAAGAPAA